MHHALEEMLGPAIEAAALALFRLGLEQARAHIIGVSDRRAAPETKIATANVTANSRNKRPITPPMKSRGMSTAIKDTVSEMMVKPICFEPLERGVHRRVAGF